MQTPSSPSQTNLVILNLVQDGLPTSWSHCALLQLVLLLLRLIKPLLQHVQVLHDPLGVGQGDPQLLQEVVDAHLKGVVSLYDLSC